MLSVIIPVYNDEEFLKETIGYIRNSSYEDLEIIIVDDGSTDNSLLIAKDIEKSDNRIKVYHKENAGVVSARNYGLAHANGEYICFADQDDIVEPEMYLKLIKKIEYDNSDFGICSSGKYVLNKKYPNDIQSDAVYEQEQIWYHLLYPMLFSNFDVPIEREMINRESHIWVCIFKRQFFENQNIKFRAYINYEDDLLVKTEALLKANRVSTVSYIGYYWRIHTTSQSAKVKYINDLGKKQDLVINDLFQNLKEAGIGNNILDMFVNVFHCKQYFDAIVYLCGKNKLKNDKFIKSYYIENIYNRDFDNSIKAVKYYSGRKIRYRVVYYLLKRKMTFCSYYAQILIDKIISSKNLVKSIVVSWQEKNLIFS